MSPLIPADAYGALPRQASAPIAAIATDTTWHIATLSKCATPVLRTAYVVTPGFTNTQRLAAEVRAMALLVPPLTAALNSRWILDGTLDAIAGQSERRAPPSR